MTTTLTNKSYNGLMILATNKERKSKNICQQMCGEIPKIQKQNLL